MTTKLTKPVRRDTEELVRDRGKMRRIIVTVYPGGVGPDYLGLRLKGCRREETITLRACLDLATKQRVIYERALKAKEKKLRREGKL